MNIELIDKLRKAASAVYLATDEIVAQEISYLLNQAADEIENLRKSKKGKQK